MQESPVTTVVTDSRGRAALGRKDQTFRMTTLDDGSILLEPARVYTDVEIELLTNRTLKNAVVESTRDLEAGRTRARRPRKS